MDYYMTNDHFVLSLSKIKRIGLTSNHNGPLWGDYILEMNNLNVGCTSDM